MILTVELRSAVFKQNDNKAPGLDHLPAEIFKETYDLISLLLMRIYNKVYSSGIYPDSWGRGIITPVYKKGDPYLAQNYRGITLVNILAKIYSQLLPTRLTKWSNEYESVRFSKTKVYY